MPCCRRGAPTSYHQHTLPRLLAVGASGTCTHRVVLLIALLYSVENPIGDSAVVAYTELEGALEDRRAEDRTPVGAGVRGALWARLNTMYFYDSNTGTLLLLRSRGVSSAPPESLTYCHGDRTAVGGCARTEPQDPGNLELDWLEVQLQMFRDRGMQVRRAAPIGWTLN